MGYNVHSLSFHSNQHNEVQKNASVEAKALTAVTVGFSNYQCRLPVYQETATLPTPSI